MRTPTPLILVADDEVHILQVVALKLRHAGYAVITASDGEEAFLLAQQHQPDVIITDHQMPYLSGLELCQKLRQEPRTAHIPAIMLTARGFRLAGEALDATNIAAVINKPFSPREILLQVQDLVAAQSHPEMGGAR